jgi:hypothetical protein
MGVLPIQGMCSVLTRAAEMSPAGTAAEAHTVVVVEVDEPWAAKALAGCSLPDLVKRHLAELDRDGVRVLLARGEVGGAALHEPGTRALVVGDGQGVRRYRFREPEQLLALRRGAAAGDAVRPRVLDAPGLPAVPVGGDVWLVCTNGKRDACCAKFGLPLYGALAEAALGGSVSVWQCSHLGGHRFAPTCSVLLAGGAAHGPGYAYAYVEPGAAAALLAAHGRGQLGDLAFVRGRHGLTMAAQAAELEVRRRAGLTELDAVARVVITAAAPDDAPADAADVEVVTRTAVHRVRVTPVDGARIAPKSCGDEPTPIGGWQVVDLDLHGSAA